MPTKQVKLAVLTSGVDRALSDMQSLSKVKSELSASDTTIRMSLKDADLTEAKLKELSAQIKMLSEKGATIRVNLSGTTGDFAKVSAEADALAASGARVSATMGKAGDDLEKAGSKAEGMGTKLKGAISSIGNAAGFSPALIGFGAIGGAIGGCIDAALHAQSAIALLKSAIHDAGGSWNQYAGSITATEDSMAKYGDSAATVDSALTILIRATGNVKESESLMGTAANLAAARHIDLSSACGLLARASGGAMRGMKDLGITQVTGATQAKAMGTAQTTLQDQINAAGGMAKFAAAHHMSLASAQKLVAQASGEAGVAVNELSRYGLTATSAQTLLTQAENGNGAALKKLAGLHLTEAQLQNMVKGATSGSIDAYNQLGIIVLPKTATAAERLSQIQSVLNQRIGGAAAAQAATFSGQVAVLKAEFIDMAERIGQKLLPVLSAVMGVFVKIAGNKVALTMIGIALGLIAAGFIGIGVAAAGAAIAENAATFGLAAVIAAVIMGLAYMLTHWRQTCDFFKREWPIMLGVISGGFGLAIVELIKHWSTCINALHGAWSTFCGWIHTAWSNVVNALHLAWSDFTNFFGGLANKIHEGWSTVCNALHQAWSSVCNFLHSAWSAVANWFSSAWQSFLNIFKNIGQGISGAWSTVCSAFVNAWRAVANWFVGAWNGFVAFFKTIGHDINSAWNTVVTTVKNVWSAASSWFANVWNGFLSFWKNIGTNISNAWNNVVNAVKNVWSAASSWFSNMWNGFLNFWKNIGSNISNTWNGVVSTVKNIWSTASSWFSSMWNNFLSFWKNIGSNISNAWNNVVNTVKNAWSAASGWFSSMWSNFLTTFQHIGSAIATFWQNNVINPIRNAWNTFQGWLVGIWNGLKATCSTIWTDIKNDMTTPIAWVVNNIWDKFAGIINAVTKFLNLGFTLPIIHMAEGGIVEGPRSLGDNIPVLATAGERILSLDQVAILGGHAAIDRMVGRGTGGDGGHFAGGGIPGWLNPINAIKGIANAAWSALKDIGNWAKSLAVGALETTVKPVVDGILGGLSAMPGANSDYGRMITAIPKAVANAFFSFLTNQDQAVAASTGGSGGSIVQYAESFIGKLPYVWGGTSLTTGADCSGFVMKIYEHFGYNPPRTSDQQWRWVQKTSSPQVGGLVFFAGSDGTKANPGHVGIIVGTNKMVDEYETGRKAEFDTFTTSGALAGYGIPPGGFKGGTTGAGTMTSSPVNISGNVSTWLSQALSITKEPTSWLSPLGRLVALESGGNASAVNTIAVLGQHATGLLQTLPSTFASYDISGHTNIMNPVDNAIAAIRYIAARYGSPTAIPGLYSGSYHGYAGGGIINELIAGVGMRTGRGYTFGEDGTEIVMPLSGSMALQSGGGNIYIKVDAGDCVDPNAVAQAIHQKLRNYKRLKGNQPLGFD